MSAHVGGPIEELLERSGRFFTAGEVSDDLRTVTRRGGREGDVFYRDRWSHDKVVRSTHGVNCTGSCSWKVYVKDGIITWETQETDYPSVGPDRPEYEPRGCPRGAAFSWYTYSPTRVRYPYARGVLVEMYREASARLGDPVLAWADIQADPQRRRRYQQARGKGGLVRVSWAEATEMIAAAHVHTIKEYGPDRVCRLLADPGDVDGVVRGRVPVHRADRRGDDVVLRLVRRSAGGLAAGVRRPDRCAGVRGLVGRAYLMMWGSNVPVTRTPDAHWMAEVRYRGTKVRQRQPRLRRQHEVRRRVDAVCGGDRRGAGDGDGSRHPVGMLRAATGFRSSSTTCGSYTDLPFLVKLEERDGVLVPGKNLTAADLGGRTWRTPRSNRCCSTGRPTPSRCRKGSLGFRYGDDGVGKWNLESRRPGTGFDRRAGPAGRPRWFICRASTRSTGTARRWRGACRCGGSASTASARCST